MIGPEERARLLRMPPEEFVHILAGEREATSRMRQVAERLAQRGGDTTGPFAGMPWYIRALAWFGLPVVLVIFSQAQDAGWVPSLARTTHANVAVIAAAFTAHVEKTDELLARMTTGLRIMCENAAKDQSERNNCGLIR